MRILNTSMGVIGLYVLVGVIVYGPSVILNDFIHLDDIVLIVNNPIVHAFNLSTIWQAFTSYDPELYVPLTLLSYQIDHLIAGLSPVMFHLTNLILHVSNALLVMWLFVLLFRERWVALLCGLLFLVHPLNTEAVAWAAARKDLLSGLFFLLTVIFYLKDKRKHSLSFYLLGLLSKVSIVLTPFVFVLLDWVQGKKIDKENWKSKWPYFGLSLVFLVIAHFGKETNAALYYEKFLIGCKSIIFYLQKWVLPEGLSIMYPFTEPISLLSPSLLLSVFLVSTISIAVVVAWKYGNQKTVLLAWSLYLLLLIPSFTNIAKGHDELLNVYLASDRYVYLPMIGILMVVATVLMRFQPRSLSVGAAACAVYGILSLNQSFVWRDNEAVFRHTLVHYPNSHVAHTMVGAAHFEREEVAEAMAYFQQSLSVRKNGLAYFNMGQVLLSLGRGEDAIAAFRASTESSKTDPDAYFYLGALLLEKGDREGAREALERAATLAPGDARIQEYLQKL